MNLSIILHSCGILGSINTKLDTISTIIIVIFFDFKYINKTYLKKLLFIVIVIVILTVSCFYKIQEFVEIGNIITQYTNICLSLIFVLSIYILFYITITNKNFKNRYPALYFTLIIFFVSLIIVIFVYFFIKFMYVLVNMYKILTDDAGYSGKGKGVDRGPSSTGGSNNPSGSGDPGKGGGNQGVNVSHDETRKRKRSSSSSSNSSSSTGSSWSEYSDLVRQKDSANIVYKKFANFLYDKQHIPGSSDVPNRKIFDNSNLNPVNWNLNGSESNEYLGRRIIERILVEHKRRESMINSGRSYKVYDIFTLRDIGIIKGHPDYYRLKDILYPNTPDDLDITSTNVYNKWIRDKVIKEILNKK